DPTVLYGRDLGVPGSNRALTHADLHHPTPYNTYTIPGLPPAPIANPGREALLAAVDPAHVDYLYFVARGDGTHQFSRTLADHNPAVARFRYSIRRASTASGKSAAPASPAAARHSQFPPGGSPAPDPRRSLGSAFILHRPSFGAAGGRSTP